MGVDWRPAFGEEPAILTSLKRLPDTRTMYVSGQAEKKSNYPGRRAPGVFGDPKGRRRCRAD